MRKQTQTVLWSTRTRMETNCMYDLTDSTKPVVHTQPARILPSDVG